MLFKKTRENIKEDPESFRAYIFGYTLGLGAGFAACKYLTRDAVKGMAIKSADLLLREDGASVIMVRLANGTVRTLTKEAVKELTKV